MLTAETLSTKVLGLFTIDAFVIAVTEANVIGVVVQTCCSIHAGTRLASICPLIAIGSRVTTVAVTGVRIILGHTRTKAAGTRPARILFLITKLALVTVQTFTFERVLQVHTARRSFWTARIRGAHVEIELAIFSREARRTCTLKWVTWGHNSDHE